MKILVTGANGFVGRNVLANFRTHKDLEILPYDLDTGVEMLNRWAKECDFVVHLAGVNRPKTEDEFTKGNTDFTCQLLELLSDNPVPLAMTSSIQAALDNPYGISKFGAEQRVFEYSKEHDVPVYVWRMPNIFGKWCRPNYNSAVATFCYNIARDEEVYISDPARMMNLIYIDDVVELIYKAVCGEISTDSSGFCTPEPVY